MKTRVLETRPGRRALAAARALGEMLGSGAVVVFPTETVYGIGAPRADAEAVARLRRIKGRTEEKPLTVHLADPGDVEALAAPLSRRARRLADRLWPGPVTLVLPDAGGDTTGFRVPDSSVTRELLRAAGTIVAATSANRAGHPPAVNGEDAVREFRGEVDGILSAGRCRLGRPSTVVRVAGEDLEILREGAMAARAVIRAACRVVLFVCTGNLCRSPMAAAILEARLATRLRCATEDLPSLGFLVLSAGTGSLAGEPATPAARRAAGSWGGDLSGHVSRPLTPGLIAQAEHIYAAEPAHARTILEVDPAAAPRVAMIRGDGRPLADPIGGTEAAYRETARLIARSADRIAEEVLRAEARDE